MSWLDDIAPPPDDEYSYQYGVPKPIQPLNSTQQGFWDVLTNPLGAISRGSGAAPAETGQMRDPRANSTALRGRVNQRNNVPGQPPPGELDWSRLFERGPNTGGSAGYDNRGAVAAYFDQMRQQAESQYGGAQTDLTQVYDQLANMIEPMAAQTAAAYDDAIGAGADQSEALIAATQERISSEAATRAAAFAELGISGGGELSDTAMEAERGMSDIGANAANWGGLMGAFSTGQQSRMNQDYVGAGDAKVMAIEDLVSRYQDYLRMLDQSETDQMATAYQPGSAGTPGKMGWETMGSTGNKLLEQYMIDSGYLPGPTAPEPYTPAYARDLQWAVDSKMATPEQIAYMQQQNAQGQGGLEAAAVSGNPLFNPGLVKYIQ